MATIETKWHRPEFKGRESELVNLAEAGRLAGVTRASVSNWRKRHEDFPALVLEVGMTKWVVREEFLAWEKAHGTKPPAERTGPKGPRRCRKEAVIERMGQLERGIAEMERRQAKQAEALARTTVRLKELRTELRVAEEILKGL